MICTSVFLLPAVLLALKITEGIITHCNNEVFVNDNYELDITLIKPSSRNQMVFFQYYILDLTLPVLKSCRELLFWVFFWSHASNLNLPLQVLLERKSLQGGEGE